MGVRGVPGEYIGVFPDDIVMDPGGGVGDHVDGRPTAVGLVLVDEVVAITQDEVAYIPLYTQPLIWAAKDNVDLTQRADNFFMLRWVTVN